MREVVKDILGWLTFEEAELLQRLTFFTSGLPGDLVEIGSYCGRSTVSIGLELKAGCTGKLYAVDPHIDNFETYGVRSLQQLQSNLDRLKLTDVVEVHKATSEEFVKWYVGNVKMLFIDGAHDLENVQRDFDLFKDKMVKGGVVAFHDTDEEGPMTVVKDIYENMADEWQAVTQVRSIVAFRKL